MASFTHPIPFNSLLSGAGCLKTEGFDKMFDHGVTSAVYQLRFCSKGLPGRGKGNV